MRYYPLSLLLLLLLPSQASALQRSSIVHPQPGLTVSTRIVRYQIHGRTTADLRAQMSRLGPLDYPSGRRYDAYANWTFSWHVHYRSASGRCRLTGASVLIALKYTLPRWLRPPRASAALVRHWNRYLKALRRHENGHGTIAIAAGQKMTRRMRALDPRSSCNKVEAAADLIGAGEIERANTVEAAYDARTNHGASQGARFP